MSEHTNPQNKYKRKRKKSFLTNAKKYAKKGCYGRGSQLDADTYQYFVRIMEAYKEGFPSEDDKCKFLLFLLFWCSGAAKFSARASSHNLKLSH